MKKRLEEDFDNIFIAYSYPYVDLAIKSLENNPKAEAVLIKPYEKKRAFSSSIKYMNNYKSDKRIPILITSDSRHSDTGQYFEYGSRLIDILDMENEVEKAKAKEKLRRGE